MSRKTRYPGIVQRCPDTCTAEPCRRHGYRVQVDLRASGNGQPSNTFTTLAEAKTWRDEIVNRHRNGQVGNLKLTVGDYLTTWLATKEANGLKPSTVKGYREHIEVHLTPGIGTIKLTDLRPSHLNALYAKLRKERKISAATVVRINATLKSALTSAERSGEVSRNVAKLIEPPKDAATTTASSDVDSELAEEMGSELQIWTPKEYGAFLTAATDELLLPLFSLAAITGLRRGELVALRWQDVDLDGRFLIVRKNAVVVGKLGVIVGTPKTKASRNRRVDLDPTTVALLRMCKKSEARNRLAAGSAWAESGRVFTDEFGAMFHPQRVSRTFDRITRRAYMPGRIEGLLPISPDISIDIDRTPIRVVRFHDLRHFAASVMIAAGIGLEIVSKILGHSSIAITSRLYSHLLPDAGADAATRMAAYLAKAMG